MQTQLNYVMFQYRSAELRRAGEKARLATEVNAKRRRLRAPNRINHASDRSWPLRTKPVAERTIGGAR